MREAELETRAALLTYKPTPATSNRNRALDAAPIEEPLKKREDRARRALARGGYAMRKTPARSWECKYFAPGYHVYREYTNTTVLGAGNRLYSATIEDVEAFAATIDQHL